MVGPTKRKSRSVSAALIASDSRERAGRSRSVRRRNCFGFPPTKFQRKAPNEPSVSWNPRNARAFPIAAFTFWRLRTIPGSFRICAILLRSKRSVRYLRVVEDQGRYVASLAEMAPPTPARGETLIRVAASGVNRADLSQIAGRYPPPPGEPDILGLEAAGTLEETGERVCALLAGGGHAELVAAPVGQVVPTPAGVDLGTAAGIPGAFLPAV